MARQRLQLAAMNLKLITAQLLRRRNQDLAADVMKRLNQSAWLRRSSTLCISTLHVSLIKSGAARSIRERVIKIRPHACVRGLCISTALAKFYNA